MKALRLLGLVLIMGLSGVQGAIAQESDGEQHWRALRQESQDYQSQQNYAEAIRSAEAAVLAAKETFGIAHTNYAISVNDVANLYRLVYTAARQQYLNSVPLYKSALNILEKNLGTEDPKVAIVLNNLASLYSERGEHKSAEQTYLRTLDLWQKNFGIDHPNLAVIWNNLANLYTQMGETDKAMEAAQRAALLLNGSEESALGSLVQGKMARAVEADRKENEKSAKPRKPKHVQMENDGVPVTDRIEQELLWRLNGLERALGPAHANLVPTLKDLGLYYETSSRTDKAEAVYVRALDILFASEDSDLAEEGEILNRMGNLYLAEYSLDEAESRFSQAAEVNTKALGPSHQAVGLSMKGQGDVAYIRAQYDQAAVKYKQALEILEVSLGKRNLVCEEVRLNLVDALEMDGRGAEAAAYRDTKPE